MWISRVNERQFLLAGESFVGFVVRLHSGRIIPADRPIDLQRLLCPDSVEKLAEVEARRRHV